ncbi:MAG: hypothetical protein PHS53_01340 [Candidatus Pacebacteria bacterium]|nr:hypothetical protein [Candidatus Paceibacterota bacterium]MDD5356777.1 hypothetical protein [Candidatus Paceibacterota bacterium]
MKKKIAKPKAKKALKIGKKIEKVAIISKKEKFSPSVTHVWSILCRSSNIDPQTNNISLSNVIERVTLKRDPKLVQYDGGLSSEIKPDVVIGIPLEIVSLWRRNVSGAELKADVAVDLYGPNGEVINTFPYNFEMKNEHRRIRTRLLFGEIHTKGGGDHFLVVKVKEMGEQDFRPVAHIPLEVVIQQ